MSRHRLRDWFIDAIRSLRLRIDRYLVGRRGRVDETSVRGIRRSRPDLHSFAGILRFHRNGDSIPQLVDRNGGLVRPYFSLFPSLHSTRLLSLQTNLLPPLRPAIPMQARHRLLPLHGICQTHLRYLDRPLGMGRRPSSSSNRRTDPSPHRRTRTRDAGWDHRTSPSRR